MYKRKGVWYSDFEHEGKRYQKSLKVTQKSIAERKDRQFRHEVESGKYQSKQSNIPFDIAVDDFVKSRVKMKSHKADGYRAAHLKKYFGKRRIHSIEGNQVLMQGYLKMRQAEVEAFQTARGRNPSEFTYGTINRELAFLSKMFNDLIEAGKATRNPVKLVTMFKEIERETVLEPDVEQKILDTIINMDVRYQHMTDLIMTLLHTACRLDEVLGMKRDWVNLAAGVIEIPPGNQKRGTKVKRVPINSIVEPIIKRQMRKNKGCEYVLSTRKQTPDLQASITPGARF